MRMNAWIEQIAKIADIEEAIKISELPMFLTDNDSKIRERAAKRLKELLHEQNEAIQRGVHSKLVEGGRVK